MNNFRTYDLAIQLYQQCKRTKLKHYANNQLLRASLSVCLNLAEGNERSTVKDKRRFLVIALTSHREVQSIIRIEELIELHELSDKLGAYLYRLCHSPRLLTHSPNPGP
ncbi:MAG: four helix bundle protein [Halobacteriovoraceae bacterium]|nr:four helix bundle protein [Halobacteriovoraceae bacterium]MCB9095465.1 four helix bundle protein [Halobacteriovoraceae bacterium]